MHSHARSREFLGDSLARARQSRAVPRGIVALARCHGRVKISKSTGFARRTTGEARRRLGETSARRASWRNNDDDRARAHVGARVPCARVHTARAALVLAAGEASTRRGRTNDDKLPLRRSVNDDRRARHCLASRNHIHRSIWQFSLSLSFFSHREKSHIYVSGDVVVSQG